MSRVMFSCDFSYILTSGMNYLTSSGFKLQETSSQYKNKIHISVITNSHISPSQENFSVTERAIPKADLHT